MFWTRATMLAAAALVTWFGCTDDFDQLGQSGSTTGVVTAGAGGGPTGSGGVPTGGMTASSSGGGGATSPDASTATTGGSGGMGCTPCGSKCFDTMNDPAHCGGCDVVCSGNHGTPSCAGGMCAIACDPGFVDCNMNPQKDGCEADLKTNGTCGSCNNACGTLKCYEANPEGNAAFCGCKDNAGCTSGGSCDASGICDCGGSCQPGEMCGHTGVILFCTCNGGNACDSSETCCPAAGCVDLKNSDANCGACGNACSGGTSCNSGTCS